MFHFLEVDVSSSCLSILGVVYFIRELLKVVCFIIPMGLIVMLSFDFFKQVVSVDENNKFINVAVKRIIFAVVIFLLPNSVFGLLACLNVNSDEGESCYNYVDDVSVDEINQIMKDQEKALQKELERLEDEAGMDASTKISALAKKKSWLTIVDSGKEDEDNDDTNTGDYIILINPSHQAFNDTVSSKANYKTEKDSMFQLAREFKKYFESQGYDTEVAPSSGDIGSASRCWEISDSRDEEPNWSQCGYLQVQEMVKKGKGRKVVYLALHSNALNGTSHGPQVYYASGNAKSQDLSKRICNNLVKTYKDNNITPTGDCSLTSASVSEPSLFYKAGGTGGGVLIEIGFHDNSTDQAFIESSGKKLAKAVLKGVKNYFKANDPADSKKGSSAKEETGRKVPALYTAYYPADNSMEGGKVDAFGNPLNPSHPTLAGPPEVPLKSKVQMLNTGTELDYTVFDVLDHGSAIQIKQDENGNRYYIFDVLKSSDAECNEWGRVWGDAILIGS